KAAQRAEARRLLEAKIDELPDAFRSVFVLRGVEEMTVEEVAAVLDIPEATVRTRFFRARGMLRESLSRDIDTAHGDAFSFARALRPHRRQCHGAAGIRVLTNSTFQSENP